MLGFSKKVKKMLLVCLHLHNHRKQHAHIISFVSSAFVTFLLTCIVSLVTSIVLLAKSNVDFIVIPYSLFMIFYILSCSM